VDGSSYDFANLRRQMIAGQLVRRGITDQRVLDAMDAVPREEFTPPEFRHQAYEDTPHPIGFEQTISQPYTVAFMCQEAALKGRERVLEIGTGSGYGAAVLSKLAREVHTFERIPELAESAAARLSRLGFHNVTVHLGDGSEGLPEHVPFDVIVVTAGATEIPATLQEQVADGGRIVIPIGPPGDQGMFRFNRRGDQWDTDYLGRFGFVPLVRD
jgi:protein-L-isoaspartate(D-aspartate) O-methyltransferase